VNVGPALTRTLLIFPLHSTAVFFGKLCNLFDLFTLARRRVY
jgi:hypothetical protein